MNTINILVAAFIAIIVGLMLLGTVASSTYNVTGRGTAIVDERLNLSSSYNSNSGFMNATITRTLAQNGVQCSSGDGKWVNGQFVITNSSGTVLTSGNYTVDYSGQTVAFKNTSTTDPVSYGSSFFGGNITLIDYQYYPGDYICSGWQRTVLNMTPGFFGLAIFAVGLGLFYLVAKQEGIFGNL